MPWVDSGGPGEVEALASRTGPEGWGGAWPDPYSAALDQILEKAGTCQLQPD